MDLRLGQARSHADGVVECLGLDPTAGRLQPDPLEDPTARPQPLHVIGRDTDEELAGGLDDVGRPLVVERWRRQANLLGHPVHEHRGERRQPILVGLEQVPRDLIGRTIRRRARLPFRVVSTEPHRLGLQDLSC